MIRTRKESAGNEKVIHKFGIRINELGLQDSFQPLLKR
jgi:hypothetical protein